MRYKSNKTKTPKEPNQSTEPRKKDERYLSEFLLDNLCHKEGFELGLTRDNDMGRPTIDFDEE